MEIKTMTPEVRNQFTELIIGLLKQETERYASKDGTPIPSVAIHADITDFFNGITDEDIETIIEER